MEERTLQTSDSQDKPVKNRRIDLRLEAKQKALLEAAATVTGQSLMSFVVSNSLTAARNVLHEYRATELSFADFEKFMHMLENPEEPNTALLNAARRHRQKTKSSHDL
ncbi:MAG: DUF1778 domain-containing protein [Bacteroidetes bacterium]|nr:DUF1778 domain-containing protein [Bacteroidota bacterium]